jgi:hypothetical protein
MILIHPICADSFQLHQTSQFNWICLGLGVDLNTKIKHLTLCGESFVHLVAQPSSLRSQVTLYDHLAKVSFQVTLPTPTPPQHVLHTIKLLTALILTNIRICWLILLYPINLKNFQLISL